MLCCNIGSLTRDLVEIYGDMEAYHMWKDSKGWSVVECEALENFLEIQRKMEEPKEPKECTEYFRQWIDVKAIANIQDVLLVDNVNGVLAGIEALQGRYAASIERVNQLLMTMEEIGAPARPPEVHIKSVSLERGFRRLSMRRLDSETVCDAISTLLKEIHFEDEEYMPIIKEMKHQVGLIFKEAGCQVDETEVSIAKGKARLEEALGQWYQIIDSFVDRLLQQSRKSMRIIRSR